MDEENRTQIHREIADEDENEKKKLLSRAVLVKLGNLYEKREGAVVDMRKEKEKENLIKWGCFPLLPNLGFGNCE